jgi:hypothetical protein
VRPVAHVACHPQNPLSSSYRSSMQMAPRQDMGPIDLPQPALSHNCFINSLL